MGARYNNNGHDYRDLVIVKSVGPHAESVYRELRSIVQKETGENPDSLGLDRESTLIEANVARFLNGEMDAEIGGNVRKRDVYVVHSFHDPTHPEWTLNDTLVALMAVNNATRVYGVADSVTDILPYLPYLRADRTDFGRKPITAKLTIRAIENSGAYEIFTFDMHSRQAQGFGDGPINNAFLMKFFAERLSGIQDTVIVVGADVGSVKLTKAMARKLSTLRGEDVYFGLFDKDRPTTEKGYVKSGIFIGDKEQVKDAVVVVPDDMIDTGGTNEAVTVALRDMGAKRVISTAPHALLSRYVIKETGEWKRAEDRLRACGAEIMTTDSVPRSAEYLNAHSDIIVDVLPVAPLAAQAIYRMRRGGTIRGYFSEK